MLLGKLIKMTRRKAMILSCNLKLDEANNWITIDNMKGRLNVAMNRMTSMATLNSLLDYLFHHWIHHKILRLMDSYKFSFLV